MFLPSENSPFKCSYLPGTVPLNVRTCQEQSLYCSYLPGTVTLLFLPTRSSPFIVPICQEQSLYCSYLPEQSLYCSFLPGTVPLLFLPPRTSPFKCSYLLGTGRNRRRKQRRKRTGQCAADPKSTNQSIN